MKKWRQELANEFAELITSFIPYKDGRYRFPFDDRKELVIIFQIKHRGNAYINNINNSFTIGTHIGFAYQKKKTYLGKEDFFNVLFSYVGERRTRLLLQELRIALI